MKESSHKRGHVKSIVSANALDDTSARPESGELSLDALTGMKIAGLSVTLRGNDRSTPTLEDIRKLKCRVWSILMAEHPLG